MYKCFYTFWYPLILFLAYEDFHVFIIISANHLHSIILQILDDKGVKRRFRASNFQSNTRVKPFICTMPMRLDEGWNQIQFNLADFTKRAYGTAYVETLRIQVHKDDLKLIAVVLNSLILLNILIE